MDLYNEEKTLLRIEKFSEIKAFHVFYFALAILLVVGLGYNLFSGVPEDTSLRLLEVDFPRFEIALAPGVVSQDSNGLVNLTILDDSDNSLSRFTECTDYCAAKLKSFSVWNVFFYANYTGLEGDVIDDTTGNCEINFTVEGSVVAPAAMIYNSGAMLYEYNRTFTDKGDHDFEVYCSNLTAGGEIGILNDFRISNTAPFIVKTPDGFVDFDVLGTPGILSCIEDQLCTYDFNTNISEDDLNDILDYDYIAENTTLTNFSFDTVTGILEVNVTTNSNTGSREIELTVQDSDLARDTAKLKVDVLPVNDAPRIIGLRNVSFNRSFLFEEVYSIIDEEGDYPISVNISFLSCDLAPWNTSNDCVLFREDNYTLVDSDPASLNISFTPNRDAVGIYIINFTTYDSATPNASISVIVNFTVDNVNEEPIYRYVCDNELITSEDSDFSCEINLTDIDEDLELTLVSNESWFTFGDSGINPIILPIGVATEYNATAIVNFTPSDSEVGNWLINITTSDSVSPPGVNSTIISFNISNVDDEVTIQQAGSFDAFTSNNYTLFLNATDDDLLIPPGSVYTESLSFTSNLSWVTVSSAGIMPGTNISVARIDFDPNDAGGPGSYNVNITVTDANLFSIDSTVLTINVISNGAPFWLTPPTENSLTEDVNFVLNLTEHVTDPDGDSLNFTYSSDTSFPAFDAGFNLATGLIDLTGSDPDVGQHLLIINVSDGVSSVPLSFNFTVYNVNDLPFIQRPIFANNASVDIDSNVDAFEDTPTEISFFVEDDDSKIPTSQSAFFTEVIAISLVSVGPNTELVSFSQDLAFPIPGDNKTLFVASFTPNKSDTGFYLMELNASDLAGSLNSLTFNLTVHAVPHNPVLEELVDQTAAVDHDFYYDINSTDPEDGDDSSGNLTYTYGFLPNGRTDNDFINGDESIFNTTSGVLNVSFDALDAGVYHLNITVTDSSTLKDNGTFYLYVNDQPQILNPNPLHLFNLSEGNQSNLTFLATTNGNGNLTYEIYINDSLRFNASSYGDGTTSTFVLTPGYADESYGLFVNLTLRVFVPGFFDLNSSMTWNANISHNNAPVNFTNVMPNSQGVVGTPLVIDLKRYFSDADYFDVHYNQTVNFTLLSNSSVNSSLIYSFDSDWNLTLEATGPLLELINITGIDYNDSGSPLTNDISNNFIIEFTEVPPVTVPSGGGGGGGGGGSSKEPVPLKIIVPEPVSADKGDRIVLPIKLVNEGSVVLRNIDLESVLAIDGLVREDILAYFDKTNIAKLLPGQEEEVILIMEVSPDGEGLYEITVTANAKAPKFLDTGKIYINVRENKNATDKFIFTEELIASNPECIEIQEVLDEASDLIATGEVDLADVKLEEAVQACRNAIAQRSLFSRQRLREKLEDKIFIYLLVATLLAFVLGVVYYVYRNVMLRGAASTRASTQQVESDVEQAIGDARRLPEET